MNYENIYYSTQKMTLERFTWITELLKLFCSHHYPESFHHHPRTQVPSFSIFFSGDACYSLINRQYSHLWEILFRLPHIRFLFDTRDLLMRGISIEPFQRRSPDQFIPVSPGHDGASIDFAGAILRKVIQPDSEDRSLGFLYLESPYLGSSGQGVVDLFHAAIRERVSPEWYGYLDGIYAMHHNQQPTMCENAGDSLMKVNSAANKKGLYPLFLLCSQSASARGFSTFTGENRKIVSFCTIPQVKIRDISEIAARFCKPYPILSHSALRIQVPRNPRVPTIKPEASPDPPPLIVLVTHSPYGNELSAGAITFASACAHKGIATRVIFLEDGVYTFFGRHALGETAPCLNLQSVITKVSSRDNLECYAYIPSFRERGLQGNLSLKGVQLIDTPLLAQIFFQLPGGVVASHQRVLIF